MNQEREDRALALRPTDSGALAKLVEADQRAQDSFDASIPENTRRAYVFELHCFASWCTRHGLAAMPADPRTIRVYLRELADSGRDERDIPPQKQKKALKQGGLGLGTLMRALGAICTSHVRSEQPSPWNHPKIEEMRTALEREKGVRPKKKKAIDADLLPRIVRKIPTDTLLGVRDRALILLGWHCGRRRSEVVGARVEHFEKRRTGMIWLIPKSKTDQKGEGHEAPVVFADDERFCAVLSLEEWLKRSGITEGPVFRAIDRFGNIAKQPLTGEMVALRVKHYAEAAGLDPKIFAGHSLRSGWMTAAAAAGRDAASIMRTTGHKTEKVVREYIQHESALDRAAGKGLI